MKIAFFDDRFHEVYGAQENVLLLAELCQEAGHEVIFMSTAPGRLLDAAADRGLPTCLVPAPSPLLRFEREALTGGWRNVIRSVHAVASYNQTMRAAVKKFDADIVVASAVRPASMLAAVSLTRTAKVLLYAQNSIPFGAVASASAMMSWRVCLIGPGALRTFPRWVRPLLRRRFRDLPSGRDLSRYGNPNWVPRSRGAGEPFRVLTICSLTPRKGIQLLIEALADIRAAVNVELTVVGGTTGPKSEAHLLELQRLVESSGVEVRFAGWSDDVRPFLAESDLFVLASYDEGLPGVLIEAMAAGLPCVTTAAGSAGDLIRSCGAGLVVPIGDRSALAQAVESMATDDSARSKAALSAWREVRRHHDLKAFIDRFQKIATEHHDFGQPASVLHEETSNAKVT